jgi:hypothetical protein
MVIVAAVLLCLYFTVIVGVLLSPPRQHDPQRGQAVGCLMILAAGVAVLGVMLGIGAFLDLGLLVGFVVWTTCLPAILIGIHLVRFLLLKLWRD